MKDNKVQVLTLPMMPVDGTNYGKYVSPLICEVMKNAFNGEYIHCINLLDSFNDRTPKLQPYINSLDNNNIRYDSLWLDNKNLEELMKQIEVLIEKKMIDKKTTNVYKCECGVIEIEENKISSCNPNNLKFYKKDDELYCKKCHTKCIKNKTNVLTFTPKGVSLNDVKCSPSYLNKTIKTYDQTVINSYVTISRNRDTGIYFDWKGEKYNIDIDFIWSLYLSTFESNNKIVVTGNKVLYQLFMVGLIEKCINKNANTILVGTPYVTNIKKIVEEEDFIEDEIFRKLAIIFSMKWKTSENNYDPTLLKYLKRLSAEEREELFNYVCRNDYIDLNENAVNDLIRSKFNLQNATKKLKLERGK